jgi:cytochrome b6
VVEQKETKGSFLAWIEDRVSLTEIVSFLSLFGLLPAELDSRKRLREALAESMGRPRPSYARWPHVLGILSFILFLFLVVTGSLLSFYYQPTAAEAYRSATSIARDVTLGAIIHQAHRWASILLLGVLLLRVLRFFFSGLYARGREMVWMVAVLTFGVAMIADLSGRLLPWDARGYWTMIRAREVFDELPIIGPLSTFLVGGTGLDSLILTRFYVLHILTLPCLLLVLFYVHFSSVRRVGLSRVDAAPAVRRSLGVAMYDVILIVLFLVGGLVTLTVLWPHPFDVVADPLVTPPNARPPVYLLAPHALQEMIPSIVPVFLKGLFLEGLVAVVLLLPFIDRSGGTGPRRRLVVALGLLVCVLWIVLTWWGYRMEVAR